MSAHAHRFHIKPPYKYILTDDSITFFKSLDYTGQYILRCFLAYKLFHLAYYLLIGVSGYYLE